MTLIIVVFIGIMLMNKFENMMKNGRTRETTTEYQQSYNKEWYQIEEFSNGVYTYSGQGKVCEFEAASNDGKAIYLPFFQLNGQGIFTIKNLDSNSTVRLDICVVKNGSNSYININRVAIKGFLPPEISFSNYFKGNRKPDQSILAPLLEMGLKTGWAEYSSFMDFIYVILFIVTKNELSNSNEDVNSFRYLEQAYDRMIYHYNYMIHLADFYEKEAYYSNYQDQRNSSSSHRKETDTNKELIKTNLSILRFKNHSNITLVDIKKRYRQLSKEKHPDVGGNEDDFILIKSAYEFLMENFSEEENYI